MTQDEALTVALEALTYIHAETSVDEDELIDQAITAIKEALAQPDTDMAYTIALQRAIEWHCEGKDVPPDVAELCPYHAEELNMTLAQTELFKPDYDTQAVLVEEQQRMAKRIEELEALAERQTARIVDLQTHIDNFDGEDR